MDGVRKEEGVGALRRSFDEEARQSSKYEGERVLPAHPRAFSLSCSPWPSQSLQSCRLSFSLFLSLSGGHGPRFAVGTTRATGHEPRATRTCPIQHPARDDTLPSPSLPPFSFSISPSRSVSCFRVFSLSLFLTPLYTHDAYDRSRSRHGRWQRVRGTWPKAKPVTPVCGPSPLQTRRVLRVVHIILSWPPLFLSRFHFAFCLSLFISFSLPLSRERTSLAALSRPCRVLVPVLVPRPPSCLRLVDTPRPPRTRLPSGRPQFAVSTASLPSRRADLPLRRLPGVTARAPCHGYKVMSAVLPRRGGNDRGIAATSLRLLTVAFPDKSEVERVVTSEPN